MPGTIPSVLQARCAACNHESEVFSAGYGAIWLDEAPSKPASTLAGAVLTASTGDADVATVADGHLVPLAHPAEWDILREHGYTFDTVALAGRHVSVSRMICRRCGTMFERRRLDFGGAAGCMPGLVLGVVAIVLAWYFGAGPWAFLVGMLAVYLTWGAVALFGHLHIRLRFHERAQMVATDKDCPKCGSSDAVTVNSRGPFPCPECGEPQLGIDMVGMS